MGEGPLRAKHTRPSAAARHSRPPSARRGRSTGLPFTRECAPPAVQPPAAEDELFAPSPYAGMSQAERRKLSEHILRDTFGERLPEAPVGGAGEEEDEDWPSELHPLHPHLHEG